MQGVKKGETYIYSEAEKAWVDIYTAFGIYVTRNSYASLIQFPPTKPVDMVDWQERNGIDPDLENLWLDSREVTVNFAHKGGDLAGFWSLLTSSPTIQLRVVPLGMEFALRVTAMPRLDIVGGLEMFSIQFKDDTPQFSTSSPRTSISVPTDFYLDSTAVSEYGVRVLQGSSDSFAKYGPVKSLLLLQKHDSHGNEYDVNPSFSATGSKGVVRTGQRQFTLNCLLTAKTVGEAIGNFQSLLYALIRQNNTADITRRCMRTVSSSSLGLSLDCYYSSSSVSEFFIHGNKVWLRFSLTFEVISDK